MKAHHALKALERYYRNRYEQHVVSALILAACMGAVAVVIIIAAILNTLKGVN